MFLNSSLLYYWWICNSDEFHVLVNEISEFGLNSYEEFTDNVAQVKDLVFNLMEDYKSHSVIKTTRLGGKLSEYQEFYPRKSVQIINEIDDFIAPIYGLSEEQNEFLKTFDIEWRTD